jgi:hypothetical protein
VATASPPPAATTGVGPTTPSPVAGSSSSVDDAGATSAAFLAAVTATAVPPDLIVPTTPASLDARTNPINGRRGGSHPVPGVDGCRVDAPSPPECLVPVLDVLGFDVTGGTTAAQRRHEEQALAVLQLDAGQGKTGRLDAALADYLGLGGAASVGPGRGADEVRTIGTSAEGRPITALRYGHGTKVVVVVAETHGDEEGGLRVWLRLRTEPPPAGVTLWVVPTLNPDGLVHDTRFLADGADPNRSAPAQREQKAVVDFAIGLHPVLTVWYHQNYAWVGGSGRSMAPAAHYESIAHLGTLHRSGDCKLGFVWCPIDDAVGSSSILVELPDVLTPSDVVLHVKALRQTIATV